jgi:hypothetical protein
MTTKDAINHLTTELAKDKSEGSYYHTWQANIAMSFYDEFSREHPDNYGTFKLLHQIANQAAKNFLDLLISKANK